MKKFLIQSVLLLLVVVLGLWFYYNVSSNKPLPFFPKPQVSNQLVINNARIKVQIADSPETRSKGLSGRQSLATDEGMLFVFDKSDRYPFWMKEMNFALDFVWISGSGVADVTENVPAPAPNTPDSALTIFSAKTPIDKVLEVPAGTIKNLNIKVGDSIKLQ